MEPSADFLERDVNRNMEDCETTSRWKLNGRGPDPLNILSGSIYLTLTNSTIFLFGELSSEINHQKASLR